MADARRLDRGTWLVAAQVVCLAVVWLWPAPPMWSLPGWVVAGCWVVIAGAVLLGLWGAGGLGWFLRVHPRPAQRAELRTAGAYRLVRHPIYAAVLVGSAAGAVLAARPEPLIGFVGLSLVLHVKSGYEEGLLRERFGDAYDAYASRVPRLVPRLVPRSQA
ncbi:MAG: isoprenylcysteine carboxylmethyltransferase family protein [Jiangellales bacterium]